ncbi:MAG: hypothetical protein KDB53_11450 [Planctomycetes bacterium]|nr:hypothetical protein [Planctomycetota bacterium]
MTNRLLWIVAALGIAGDALAQDLPEPPFTFHTRSFESGEVWKLTSRYESVMSIKIGAAAAPAAETLGAKEKNREAVELTLRRLATRDDWPQWNLVYGERVAQIDVPFFGPKTITSSLSNRTFELFGPANARTIHGDGHAVSEREARIIEADVARVWSENAFVARLAGASVEPGQILDLKADEALALFGPLAREYAKVDAQSVQLTACRGIDCEGIAAVLFHLSAKVSGEVRGDESPLRLSGSLHGEVTVTLDGARVLSIEARGPLDARHDAETEDGEPAIQIRGKGQAVVGRVFLPVR